MTICQPGTNKFSEMIKGKGLKIVRLMMPLSGISPLFILWAIRGNSLIPDVSFACFCLLMALLPNAFLWLRIGTAKWNNDRCEITVGAAEDNSNRITICLWLLVMLFITDFDNFRELAATFVALSFIVFLFWRLNLHHMNLVFSMLGYRVFTIYPPDDGNPITGRAQCTVITRRVMIDLNQTIIPYRLFDGVYLDLMD